MAKKDFRDTISAMENDLAGLQQQLELLRAAIPGLQREISLVGSELAETSGNGKKLELLTKRAILREELDSLPDQVYWLKFRAVHADLLLLRARREAARSEVFRLKQKFSDLDTQMSRTSLQKQHITVMARHGHIGREEAAAQVEPLTTELQDLGPHVKTARGELARAQGRAVQCADVAKMKYQVGLDAGPDGWDKAAERLATEEREQVYKLCYPWLPWPKPWQPRP